MFGELISRESLSPQLMRLVFGGPGLAEYQPSDSTDAYVNCYFLPDEAPYEVPFSDPAVRELPAEQRPRPRRMTVRSWEQERRELTVDIAVHGDVGYAGRWAATAPLGSRLQMRGPAGGYRPDPAADGYLLVGDESALPAIAASAEQVPAGKPVLVVAEVDGRDGEIDLSSPGQLRVRWVHRAGRAPEHLLAEAVAELDLPAGRLSAFIHGEAAETRAVLWHLAARSPELVRGDGLSCSPYWRRGLDDEGWRQIKGDWVRETNAEAHRIAAGTD